MDDEVYVTYNSEQLAIEFHITHITLIKWIHQTIKKFPDLKDSFVKIKENNRIVYNIDEAGYDCLCNKYKGMKPASSEYEFKNCIIPFLNEMGYIVEYQKTILTYRVDFYVPKLNMVIEYDEDYHRQVKISQYDNKREAEITAAIDCLFIRIPARYDTIRALGYIADVIYKRLLKIKNTQSQEV